MKFDERFLDELKSRLRLSDVIGRTVKLRRQGREYVGLSPFGKEKTPSFFVNDDKGFYHDFSTGKHGDGISFLQETERLSFREAVERLAEQAGLSLPAEDPRTAERDQVRQGVLEWMELAAKWFEAQLPRPVGVGARAYLERRGLPEEHWARFRIGYAPGGRTALKDYLVAKGADPKALNETGLLIAPEDGGASYDRFRDRIIFPITDGRGRVISFGGRALDPEARAKYLNGPETFLFQKGSVLFGLPEARRLLHAGSAGGGDPPLAVVEGYMDVVACQRADIAAVAPMGTALTEEQMAVLWRLHSEPTLFFDGDGAGRRAAYRSLDRALPLLRPGRSFRFALVSGGKDPDDVLRDQGAHVLRSQIAATRPFIEVLFEQALGAAGELSTPERRTAFKADLRRRAALIGDSELAEAYKLDLLERFRRTTQPPSSAETQSVRAFQPRNARRGADRRGGEDGISLAGATPHGRVAAKALSEAIHPVAASLALELLARPELIDDQIESLEVQGFGDVALEGFAKEIIRVRLRRPDLDSAGLGRHLADAGLGRVLKEIERAASLAKAPFALPDMPSERARAEWSRTYAILLEVAALERAIKDAKLEGDFEALQSLKARRDAQKQKIASGSLWAEDVS